MFVIAFLSGFLCLLLSIPYIKQKLSPVYFFCVYVGVITILGSFQLYGMPLGTPLVYLMVFLGVAFFVLGGNVATKKYQSIYNSIEEKNELVNTEKYKYRSTLLFVLVVALIIWSLYTLVTITIPILLLGLPLNAIRGIYFGEEIEGFSISSTNMFVETYISKPFIYAIIPLFANEITKNSIDRILSKQLLILMCFLVVLSTVNSGGRFMVVLMVMVIFFSYLSRRFDEKKINKVKNINKNVIRLFVLCLPLGYILYLLSVNRTEDDEYDFAYTIYMNFCACIPHMSEKLNNVDYTYGATFLQGFGRPVMLAYKYILGDGQFPDFYQRSIEIMKILQQEVYWGKNVFNAYALPFYYFYWDGGIFAVVVESFIYGFLCTKVFIKRKLSDLHRSRYILILLYLSASSVWFAPYWVYFAFAYFYMMVLFKKVKQ